MLEGRPIIGEAKPKVGEIALQSGLQLGRQARGGLVVVVIDEPVLVAACEGVRNAHADVFIGADHLAGPGLDRLRATRQPAAQVLHRGDAGGDHLEGRIERVKIEIDPPQVHVIPLQGGHRR